MKSIKPLSFLLIVVSAYSSANWAGTWNSNGGSAGQCVPANPVTLIQTSTNVTASWTWQDSEMCQQMGLGGSPFSGTVPVPSGNSLDLVFLAGGDQVNGQLTLNGNEATFTSIDGTSIDFYRQGSNDSSDSDSDGDSTVDWAGTWNSDGGESGNCIPANPVILSQNATTVTAIWTWANSQACINYGIAGTPYNATVYTPPGNSLNLEFQVEGDLVDGTLTINGNQATFEGADGSTEVFYRSSSSSSGVSSTSGSGKSAFSISRSAFGLCLSIIYWLF